MDIEKVQFVFYVKFNKWSVISFQVPILLWVQIDYKYKQVFFNKITRKYKRKWLLLSYILRWVESDSSVWWYDVLVLDSNEKCRACTIAICGRL